MGSYYDDVLPMGSLKDKFIAFGWHVHEVENGNSHSHLIKKIELAKSDPWFEKPIVLLMKTEMGNVVLIL